MAKPKRESEYQAHVIRRLRTAFNGCVVLKNDSNLQQGIPDLIVLYGRHWAVLEVKKYGSAGVRPNQQYFIDILQGMSFAAFIFPENEEDVFHELQLTFRNSR